MFYAIKTLEMKNVALSQWLDMNLCARHLLEAMSFIQYLEIYKKKKDCILASLNIMDASLWEALSAAK